MKEEIISIITQFLNSNTAPLNAQTAEASFHAFQDFILQREINEKCIAAKHFIETNLKHNIVELYIKYFRASYSPDTPEEQLSRVLSNLFAKNNKNTFIMLEALIHKLCHEGYQLNRSSLSPSQPIDTLINDLKNHGPMVCGGYIGANCYNSSPLSLSKKIGGRSIWGWKKGAFNQDGSELHTLVVVGAEKTENQENIYFIEPNDPSNPTNIEAQKIYKMSYTRFTQQVNDIWNTAMKNMPETEQGYLLYPTN